MTPTLLLLLVAATGVLSQSCVGRCGVDDGSTGCQCNSLCVNFGDCCSDYNDVCLSCQDRCGEAYQHSRPCQCNDKCSSYNNCCDDYSDLCGGSGGLTDADLRALTEELFGLDVNNVGDQIVLNHQGQGTSGDLAPEPLFTSVSAAALSGPTIAALIALQDNYVPSVTQAEVEDAAELVEQETFLDAVMNTDVMKRTEEFLIQNNLLSMSLREKIQEIWFTMYPRSGSTLTSTGFEHSFVGEIKKGKVSGFHNWVYFYHQELNGDLNYKGWSKIVDLGKGREVLMDHFEWLGYPKSVGSMWVGTSPELDLAVYTVCFLARPSALCPVQMNDQKYKVQTWTMNYGGHVLVGSAYPDI